RRATVVIDELDAGREGPGLLRDRASDGLVAVTEIRRTLAADAIDVRASLAVVHGRSLAADEDDGPFRIDARRVCVLRGHDVRGRELRGPGQGPLGAKRRAPRDLAHERITVRRFRSAEAERM